MIRVPALAVAFAILVVPLALVLALLTPPGQVADEIAHLLRADALTRGQIIGERRILTSPDGGVRRDAGVFADPALVRLGATVPDPRGSLTRAAWEEAEALRWAGAPVFFQISPIAIYMPAFYLPAAVGLGAARLAGSEPLAAFYAARLGNVCAFAAMGCLALAAARRGRAILFCVLALPMTVSLAASCNQDGLIIAAATLAAALLTARSPARTAWAAMLIGCIVAVKPPYFPLTAALLTPLPLWRDRAILLRRCGLAGLTLLPALAWTAYAMAFVSAPSDRPPYAPGPLWPGDPATRFAATDPAAQLASLLAHPAAAFTLPWTTIIHDPNLLHTAIGVLGWLTIPLPGWLYALWMGAGGAALAGGVADPAGPRLRDMALLGAAACACIWGVYLSQYLVWTDVGALRIDGPQGRYWLPVLPLLALGLPGFGRACLARLAVLPALVAALAGSAVVPLLIVQAFYLR